jgi:hypothetical protein
MLAAAPAAATPTRLERLLRALDEIADLLDGDDTAAAHQRAQIADSAE